MTDKVMLNHSEVLTINQVCFHLSHTEVLNNKLLLM